MNTERHRVFISFQHGCQDSCKPCSSKSLLNPFFKDCQGFCGRNKENPYIPVSKCKNYSVCGHYWKERFEHLFSSQVNSFISKAVGEGDIGDGIQTDTIREKIRDEFIADATVTVVLIGPKTWSRKHVDWEIGSSIRDTKKNPRCGLLGIFLPTYPLNFDSSRGKWIFDEYTIPPRLYDNWKYTNNRFANLYQWSEDTAEIQNWIHEAFLNRNRIIPDNSYPSFKYNRSGERWNE